MQPENPESTEDAEPPSTAISWDYDTPRMSDQRQRGAEVICREATLDPIEVRRATPPEGTLAPPQRQARPAVPAHMWVAATVGAAVGAVAMAVAFALAGWLLQI